MNEELLYAHLVYLLGQDTWEDAPQERVWPTGSVLVTAAVPTELLDKVRLPLVFLRPGNGSNDNQEPGLLDVDVDVGIVVGVPQGSTGQPGIMGSNRQAGSSKGAGIFQLQERLFATVGLLSRKDGIAVQHVGRGVTQAEQVGAKYLVKRGYRFKFLGVIGQGTTYPRPAWVLATDATGGNANVSWALPPSRVDLLGVEVWRTAGSTPSTGPGDGTQVTLGTPLDTSVVDNPGAGTFTYTVFGAYDPDGDLSADFYSAGVASTVVVT